MSLNRNILNKKYYIVIPYYSEELGQNDFDKDEVREMAFSELYTRAQAIIRTLSVSGVMGRVLSSTELADLLYFDISSFVCYILVLFYQLLLYMSLQKTKTYMNMVKTLYTTQKR